MEILEKLPLQRRRIFIKTFLALLTLVPILIVAGYGYFQAYKNITDSVLSKREIMAYLAAQTLEEKFDHIIDIEKLVVSRPSVIDAIKAKKWSTAMSLTKSVREYVPFIDRIVLVDGKGIVKADDPHAIPSIIGEDFSQNRVVKPALAANGPYVGNAINRITYPRLNVVSITVPVRDTQNSSKIIAVLGIQIKLDTFLEWSRDISYSNQGFIYFVDQTGKVVGDKAYEPQGKLIDYSKLRPEKMVLEGKKGIEVFYNPIEKQKNLIAYYPIKKYGWGVMVSENIETAFAQRKAELQRIAFIFTFGVIMAIVLLYLVFKYGSLFGLSQEKEKVLLESIGDGIFAINRNRKIILWNRKAEKITGWSNKEAIGREYSKIIKLIDEKTRNLATGYIEQVLKTGQSGEMKLHTLLVTRDGREVPVGDSAAPIFDRVNKRIEGVIVVFRDATEERTLEYAKDEFVSLAAHQLRTPLGIIRWSIESLLKKKTISKTTQEALVSILESDMGLIGNVNDILNVARINQGKIQYKPQKLEVAKEVEAVVSKLIPIAKKLGIILKNVSSDNISNAETDPELFSEVLNNVLSNAIKYSKKNGTVTISLKDKVDTVEIKVQDDGIGIPEKDMDKVFKKFSRATNAGKNGVEGAGLGLFIAKQYLDVMKGSIRLESTEGKGTTVYITLPKAI